MHQTTSKESSAGQFRKAYTAGRDAYQQKVANDPRAFRIFLAIVIVGAVLGELLAYYTKWSFGIRVGITVAVVVLASYLTSRFLREAPHRGQIER